MQALIGATYLTVVGSVLSYERDKRGISQGDFARMMEMSQATWSRIEKGSSGFSIEQLAEAAVFLETTPSALLAEADKVAREMEQQNMHVEPTRKKGVSTGLLVLGGAALAALVAVAVAKNK